MPLQVIPVAPEEADSLTLAEWDALRSAERVFFERIDHPLLERLRREGVDAGPFDDDPAPGRDGWALVVDPASPRIVDLARAGALVWSSVAQAPDALTAAHGSYVVRRAAASLARLAIVMARLRSSDGCPWDRDQDHRSLRVHLLEEAHEVLDAIDRGEQGGELEEELGDLLLQVFFHAQMAADGGRFDVAGVADRIVAKLLHRHPHVFGDTTVADAAEVVRNWEAIKADEKERADPFDDVPKGLPGLLRAYKVQKRAAGLGFSASEAEARARIEGALEDADVGRALFWLVALARAGGIDPEGALREAVLEFESTLRPGA